MWSSSSGSTSVGIGRWSDRFPALWTDWGQGRWSWRQKTAAVRWNGQGYSVGWWRNRGCTRIKFRGCAWRLNVRCKTWRRLWPSNGYICHLRLWLLLILLLWLLILLLIISISTVLKATKLWWEKNIWKKSKWRQKSHKFLLCLTVVFVKIVSTPLIMLQTDILNFYWIAKKFQVIISNISFCSIEIFLVISILFYFSLKTFTMTVCVRTVWFCSTP